MMLAERRLSSAGGAVLSSVAAREVTKAEALKREFVGQVSVLRFLRSGLSDDLRSRVDAATAYPTDFDLREHAALASWQACAERLAHDADAELPT